MTTKTNLPICRINQISNNRYKITIERGEFTKEHASRISGCYFSGNQKAWVFPINNKNQQIFKKFYTGKKVGPDKKVVLEKDVWESIQEFEKYLKINRYSQSTINTYVSLITRFFIYHRNKLPGEILIEDIEKFNYYCIVSLNRSSSFQNQVISSIKKFYEKIYNRHIIIEDIERPIKNHPLPKVLSKEDINRLLNSIQNIKHKSIISIIYSAGLRRSEVLNLLIDDINSNRMVIVIRNAKGKKDRIAGLSVKMLDLLRRYYRIYKPQYYLFEGPKGKKYSAESVGIIFRRAKWRAGIEISGGVHILRHSFATHLHESGYDIRIIQEILGHKSSKTTEIYTHVSTKSIQNVKSPFDDLEKYSEEFSNIKSNHFKK
jgi:integrase/recombinase XerD